MARSARKMLEADGQQTISIGEVKQVSARLIAISFIKNRVRYDDMFSVKSPKVMNTLLKRIKQRGGKKVTAVITPDSSEDGDQHPEVIEAEAK